MVHLSAGIFSCNCSTPSFEEEENLRPNQILRIPFSDAGKEYAEDTALSEKADKQKRK